MILVIFVSARQMEFSFCANVSILILAYVRKQNLYKLSWPFHKCEFEDSVTLRTACFFCWLNCWPSVFYNESATKLKLWYWCITASSWDTSFWRECVWIKWVETCMSWDKHARISVMTTDHILFLSKMGKAVILRRPAPGPGTNV